MLRRISLALSVVVLGLLAAAPVLADGPKPNRTPDTVVYVTSQGLYFDSIVNSANPLPPHGPFQQLFLPGTNPDYPELETLSTEFGPGAPGHHGGRWWVDANENGEMDADDVYFSCPLLGPGRDAP
jgi:hypothetical protein